MDGPLERDVLDSDKWPDLLRDDTVRGSSPDRMRVARAGLVSRNPERRTFRASCTCGRPVACDHALPGPGVPPALQRAVGGRHEEIALQRERWPCSQVGDRFPGRGSESRNQRCAGGSRRGEDQNHAGREKMEFPTEEKLRCGWSFCFVYFVCCHEHQTDHQRPDDSL